MTRAVYLDHNATTPLDPRALEAMMPYLGEEFGNPSSATHAYGLKARQAVEDARIAVASLLGARPEEIIFTSGATEANNLALKGAVRPLVRAGRGGHLITTAIEHASVLAAARALEDEGLSLTVLAPDAQGVVNPASVAEALCADTVFVSIGAANGELGTLEPVTEIGALCRERPLLLHTDATQLVGKFPVNVDSLGVDLLSLSSHKLYGPKGVGALYVRSGVEIVPLFSGGGQERGLRSGTLNVPGIVGLGAAARLRMEEMEAEGRQLSSLRDRLWEGIRSIVPDACLNGHPERHLPGTLNAAFPRIDAERLMLALGEFALSAGSACHSGLGSPSPVLAAIGLSDELASSSLRFGLGRSTTAEDVESLLAALGKAVRRLRGPVPAGSPAPVRYN